MRCSPSISRTQEPKPLPPDIVRLDRNERIGPYSQNVVEAILGALTGAALSNYPDTSGLYHALARGTPACRARISCRSRF